MATYTVATGKRATFRESSATNNTYVINDDTKGATISGSVNGDIIAIEGFAGDFTASVRGRVVTLKSTVDTDVVVKFQLANTAGSTASVRFLDGDLTATYTAAKKVTLGAQTLSSKAAAVNDSALGSNDSSAIFDESGNNTPGSNFAFGSGVTEINGTDGDDSITAFSSGNVWDTGDVVLGEDGTDTLTITGNGDGNSASLVELNDIENINVRLLAASATLDATLFDGGQKFTIVANSLDNAASRLTVNNASTTDTFRIEDANVNLAVDFANLSSGVDAATLQLDGAGSGSASVIGNAATADFEGAAGATGLLDTVNISVSGDNYVTVEAGASASTFTLTGNGTINLTTNDTITSLDASALSGANYFTLTGASNVNIKGGSGNDNITLAATLSNNDTIDGGRGTDTLVATVNASVNPKSMSNVEVAQLTFAVSGGTFDGSGVAGLDTIELQTLAQSASLRSLSGVATVQVTEDFNGLDISTVSGDSLVVEFGSSSGGSGAAVSGSGTMTFTGMTTLELTALGSGTNTVSGAITIEDATNVTLTAGGSATLSLGGGGDEFAAAAAENLTLRTLGSGTLSLGTAMEDASNLSSLSVTANGGNISLADGFGTGGAITGDLSLSYVANSADISQVGAFNLTTGSANDSYTVDISVKAADNSHIALATADDFLRFGAFGTGNSADIRIGTFELIGSGSGSIDIGDISGAALGIGDINVTVAGASGSATVGVILASSIEDINLNGGNGGITFGTITTDQTINDITISGSATVGNIAASGTIGDININANSASVTLGTITLDAGSGVVGDVDITSNNGTVTLGNITANEIGTITTRGTGTTVIDLSGVSGNGVTVNLGSGTNTITVSDGGDTINLTTGTGVDTLVFNGSASGEDADTVNAFQALSGDVISFASSLSILNGGGASANAGSAASVMLLGSASAAVDTLSGDKNIFVFTSATYDDSSAMLAALQLFSVSAATGQVQHAGNLVVGWTDTAGDSHISLVSLRSGQGLATAASAAVDILVLNDTTFVSATITDAMFNIV